MSKNKKTKKKNEPPPVIVPEEPIDTNPDDTDKNNGNNAEQQGRIRTILELTFGKLYDSKYYRDAGLFLCFNDIIVMEKKI